MSLDHKEIVDDISDIIGKINVTRDLLAKNLPVVADRKMQGIYDALAHMRKKVAKDFAEGNNEGNPDE